MDAQQRVEAVLNRLVDEGRETGLQVAAYLDGELVVDAWAGAADPATGRMVDGDTLFHVFSAGKGVTATAVHVLAERGVLDYDTPIAAYWPAFAAHGKDRITLRHALTHSAGVPHLPAGTSLADCCDWPLMCRTVADLEPLWAPGTRSGYHGMTFGWLLGEVARRADGRPFGRIVAEEIAGPLGVADSLVQGITDAHAPRMAVHTDDGAGISSAPLSTPLETSPFPYSTGANHPTFLRSCVPVGATAAGRGLARMYAALACGGTLDGVRLLSPERVTEISATAVEGVDAILRRPVGRGLGYVLGGPDSPVGPTGVFGHHGTGQSTAFADPHHRFAFALTKNNLTHAPAETTTATLVAHELTTALGIPPRTPTT